LVRCSRLRYLQEFRLISESNTHKSIRTVLPPGPCVSVSGEPESCYQRDERSPAPRGKKNGTLHFVMSAFAHLNRLKCLNLTALNKHGRVYDDAQFGCLSWSACENKLLYVAERTECLSAGLLFCFFGGTWVPMPNQDRSLYCEDWGEALTNRSEPAICVVDLEIGAASVLEGVPPDVSPGQALWAPGSQAVFFIGWYHEPFRLGLKFCSNRRSALFKIDLCGHCERLSGENLSVSNPRLSPDGSTLIYLQGAVFGPHNQCLSLQQVLYLDLESGETSTLLDVVSRPQFAGMYEALPSCCWSADSQRVMFSSACRNWKPVCLFFISSFTLFTSVFVSSSSDLLDSSSQLYGSWKLLTVQRDLMVVCCSSPNTPPTLRVGFVPRAGEAVSWQTLQEPLMTFDFSWKVLDVTLPSDEENANYPGLDFGAVLVKPSRPLGETRTPLVVFIHGLLLSSESYKYSKRFDFAVFPSLILCLYPVNYRGSTGFGQHSILSLIGQIGSQDVKDVQRAVLTALERDPNLDPDRLAAIGGSHGGFLACHLLGQYPESYRVCRYASTDESFCSIPTAEALAAMLQKSPIAHAAKIKAPVLLMLGGRDRRVSPHQGMELYKALKSRGSPVRLLWFPEDGHSLSRVDTQVDCFLNTALWLHQHL
uniref:acylaminoacyl-peptidase n=1 Tax=Pundamilia nyererei TaxID=303518 RepID=A0A3B4FR26_9CICH